MQRGQKTRPPCCSAGVWPVSTTVVVLLCALLCGCCLAGAAVEEEPLALHTSLVDLLNAENALWTVSLGTPQANGQPAVWTAMREVRVEAQPLESAASLFFTPPALSSSKDGIENAEEGAYGKDNTVTEKQSAVPSGDIFTRAPHPKPFGILAQSLHGLSCEEYQTGGGGQRSAVQGRCFLLLGDGEDPFLRYKVGSTGIEEMKSDGEEAATAKTTTSARRRRQGRSSATASSGTAASGTEPRTVHSASASGLWTERIPVLGGSPAEALKKASTDTAEEHIRVGDITIDEYIREMSDARRSKQVVLTLVMVVAPKASASAVGGTDDEMHMRLECITGTFYEDMRKRTMGVLRASRTRFLDRWIWPLMFAGAIYAMVAVTVWLVARRKASQGSATSVAADTAKKQQ
ncbi:hypothetical protein LSCM1_05144 [Leishmania martiniquensis]|uniref:Uncharacterized protein n=1 Tax=Leishmania martiniquensis TaxID=1580590 RepID=A0A836H1P8_9TRYP|nr:hypothetical protein LSCM1_05144 [Leishmania martiniquensis]